MLDANPVELEKSHTVFRLILNRFLASLSMPDFISKTLKQVQYEVLKFLCKTLSHTSLCVKLPKNFRVSSWNEQAIENNSKHIIGNEVRNLRYEKLNNFLKDF